MYIYIYMTCKLLSRRSVHAEQTLACRDGDRYSDGDSDRDRYSDGDSDRDRYSDGDSSGDCYRDTGQVASAAFERCLMSSVNVHMPTRMRVAFMTMKRPYSIFGLCQSRQCANMAVVRIGGHSCLLVTWMKRIMRPCLAFWKHQAPAVAFVSELVQVTLIILHIKNKVHVLRQDSMWTELCVSEASSESSIRSIYTNTCIHTYIYIHTEIHRYTNTHIPRIGKHVAWVDRSFLQWMHGNVLICGCMHVRLLVNSHTWYRMYLCACPVWTRIWSYTWLHLNSGFTLIFGFLQLQFLNFIWLFFILFYFHSFCLFYCSYLLSSSSILLFHSTPTHLFDETQRMCVCAFQWHVLTCVSCARCSDLLDIMESTKANVSRGVPTRKSFFKYINKVPVSCLCMLHACFDVPARFPWMMHAVCDLSYCCSSPVLEAIWECCSLTVSMHVCVCACAYVRVYTCVWMLTPRVYFVDAAHVSRSSEHTLRISRLHLSSRFTFQLVEHTLNTSRFDFLLCDTWKLVKMHLTEQKDAIKGGTWREQFTWSVVHVLH